MAKFARSASRRENALSRDRIVEAAIELLDTTGEDGLTVRALSERLATGAGAIYWHIGSKGDLLSAACDTIIARTINTSSSVRATPEAAIRALALDIFDAIDAHPWVGSALSQTPGQLPIVRIAEGIGHQVRALGVSDDKRWATVAALLNYILGVAGRNAGNGQRPRTRRLKRSNFIEAVSTMWAKLDPTEFPFARSLAGQLRAHDDRVDFLTGIDLLLSGIVSLPRRSETRRTSRTATGPKSRLRMKF